MNAVEWLDAVQENIRKYFPGSSMQIQVIRSTRVKIRVEIQMAIFLDLFFREETGRVDYTLIQDNERVYGIDNLGGWHEHPSEDPDSHRNIGMLSPEDAIQHLHRVAARIIQPPEGS